MKLRVPPPPTKRSPPLFPATVHKRLEVAFGGGGGGGKRPVRSLSWRKLRPTRTPLDHFWEG